MSNTRKRPSRLGRGLSSLMATPQEPQPVAVPDAKSEQADPIKPNASEADGHDNKTPARTPKPTQSVAADTTPEQAEPAENGLLRIPVDQIERNHQQPREDFKPGALEALANSIREQGVMQPIVVRRHSSQENNTPGKNKPNAADAFRGYQIVAGERRWRAAKLAGLAEIPAVVHELTDEQTAEWALIENLQREDLNPIEKAQAFRRLANDFGLTQVQIAQRMGLERSTITNHLRLLDLSDFCLDLIKRDLLSMGQARAIAGLPNPAQQQAVAEKAVREQLSVRKVEEAVRRRLNAGETTGRASAKPANHLADLEKQLAEQLGTKVRLKTGRKKGTGSLNIEFYSLEQFDALLARMQVETI